MMTRLLLASVLLASPIGADAAEIGDVGFEDIRIEEGTPLELRGLAVLRYRLIFTVYAAALYAEAGAATDEVLEDVPKRLEIDYFYDITAEQFRRSMLHWIARNVTPATFDALRPRIEEMNALYRDVKAGDRYALTYLPGRGTQLALNGAALGTVEGPDFAAAVFSIWLGRTPLDESLKAGLLGTR
jgi:hypothetical protein